MKHSCIVRGYVLVVLKLLTVKVLIAQVLFYSSAQANTIYSTDFESPNYSAGILTGQQGWSGNSSYEITDSAIRYSKGLVSSSGGGRGLVTNNLLGSGHYVKRSFANQNSDVYFSVIINWSWDSPISGEIVWFYLSDGVGTNKSLGVVASSSSGLIKGRVSDLNGLITTANNGGALVSTKTSLIVGKLSKNSGTGYYDQLQWTVDPVDGTEAWEYSMVVNSNLSNVNMFVVRSFLSEPSNDSIIIDDICIGDKYSDVINPVSPNICNEKLVMAHNMTTVVPGINKTITYDYYDPNGLFDTIGGLNLVLPMDAWTIAEMPSDPIADRVASGSCDELLLQEIRAAQKLGIDGFQFYFPVNNTDDPGWSNELQVYVEIICRYFHVAEANDLDFKFTLCISHPRLEGATEANVSTLATQINMVLSRVAGSPNWLLTPDGEILFFTFSPETLSASISEPREQFENRNTLRDVIENVAAAYASLSVQLESDNGVSTKFIYHLRDWFYVEYIYSLNNQSPTIDDYKDYVNMVLDSFPAVCGWVDLNTETSNLGWEVVMEECQSRGRNYIQYIFPEFSMSKCWSESLKQRVTIDNVDQVLSTDELYRYYVGTGLADTWINLLNRAVDNDVPMIALASWNDYEEGHHLAPEVNHNFGFAEILKYYISIWRGDSNYDKEQAVIFFKKHPYAIAGESHIKVVRPNWMVSSNDWVTLRESDEKVQIVAILNEAAELWMGGSFCGDLEPGLTIYDFPFNDLENLTDQIDVEIMRNGNSVMSLMPPESITTSPQRTDRMTYSWSSDHAITSGEIFSGN